MMGGAYFISAAQSAFANKLIHYLRVNVPEVDPMAVIATGATQFGSTFPPTATPGILLSYMQSLHVVFAIAIALAGVAAVVSWFAKWQTIHVRM
jgi:MFS transporter, DHA2 family, glioxin efflux transporter